MGMDAGSPQIAATRDRLRGALSALWRKQSPSWLGVLLLALLGVPLAAADTPLWWFGGTLLLTAGMLLLQLTQALRARWLERLRQPRRLLGIAIRPLPLLAELASVAVLCAFPNSSR